MINENIQIIKGIGPKKAELLKSVGITTPGELLHYFPSRYDFYCYYKNISDINENTKAVFYIIYDGTAVKKYSPKIGYYVRWQVMLNGKALSFIWFNQPYIINSLVKEKKYCVKCEITYKGKFAEAVNPHFSLKQEYNQSILQPVYRVPAGISSTEIAGFIEIAFNLCRNEIDDYIPRDIAEKYGIMCLNDAIEGVHFPKNEENGILAMQRFIFEEFFMFCMRQRQLRSKRVQNGSRIEFDKDKITSFMYSLPYSLTNAQKKAIYDIAEDMMSNEPMNRIVQGDVGSGKTIVAFAACLMAKFGGKQAIIMAPTEVLARQHKESFEKIFGNTGIKSDILAGSLKANEKEYVKKAFSNGDIDVLIGTHAVLEDNVESDNVGLVITDEQHRFGVRQRFNLKMKGKPVNMLVLTATPIPRTLSMTIYGDLDVSVIDELPPGRIPVKTYALDSSMHDRIYRFIVNEVKAGRQAYIICPLVEDEEKISVKTYYDKLSSNELKEVRTAMLYGSMKPQEKDSIMKAFAEGKIDVIISTTVIEVGINVPNATVIVVENAEKFGLAQLHQLRGRVGRGKYKSYCVLMSDSKSETAKARLKTLVRTTNGFEIAEEDMRLRGAGEYFGLRQHGQQQFKLGELPRDAILFAKAASAADFVEKHKTDYIEFYSKIRQAADLLNDDIVFN